MVGFLHGEKLYGKNQWAVSWNSCGRGRVEIPEPRGHKDGAYAPFNRDYSAIRVHSNSTTRVDKRHAFSKSAGTLQRALDPSKVEPHRLGERPIEILAVEQRSFISNKGRVCNGRSFLRPFSCNQVIQGVNLVGLFSQAHFFAGNVNLFGTHLVDQGYFACIITGYGVEYNLKIEIRGGRAELLVIVEVGLEVLPKVGIVFNGYFR